MMEPGITPFHLVGKRILVFGATGGIGREVARACASMGAFVVASGRNRERLEALLGQLAGTGHGIEPFDLVDLEHVPSWMGELAQKHGQLAGVVHCAGIHQLKPLRVVNPSSCGEAFSANVTSALMVVKGFRQNAVRTGDGSVVLISSTAALVGQSGLSVYSASKGALISLARALAVELAKERIRVNCVVPSIVREGMGAELERSLGTEYFERLEAQHPLGLGTSHDVACAAVYLLSDAARWMTGTSIVLDGGNTAQ